MSGSSDHCRNVIFPLPSQSLFPGWLLRWESNETFGVRTELIPIKFFCIADSVIFIYSHLLPTREWSREHPTTTWWYLHYPCDVPLWQASCSLVFWSLIMEATVWKSLFSDCNPVVSLRPLVVPASNILWGRENILIQTLPMSFLCKGSFFSHPDRATGMPSSLWLWCLTGQGPQLGGEITLSAGLLFPLTMSLWWGGIKVWNECHMWRAFVVCIFLNVNLIILLLI